MPILTKQLVQKANKCKNWQLLRLSLKGMSTSERLSILKSYLINVQEDPCCTLTEKWVQVYNYLNKLARQGTIEPVTSKDLEDDKVVVLK